MDEDKAKQVKVIISVACIVIAIVVFFVFNKPGGSKIDINTKYLLCTNEECGASQKLTKEEFHDLLTQAGNPRGVMDFAFLCSECGEEAAYKANRCPKCQTIFLYDFETSNYRDKCPECGYSKAEERYKNSE